ncbi:MAG: hypothetical protein JSS36_07520 [Proteobacteria bacterium]|nr:hypothetical protein [Pseudomonadota bacterium]
MLKFLKNFPKFGRKAAFLSLARRAGPADPSLGAAVLSRQELQRLVLELLG